MTVCSRGKNCEFCFPKSLNVPETKSRETLRLTHYFPREYTLSALLYSKERKMNNTYDLYDNCISRYHDNKSKIL